MKDKLDGLLRTWSAQHTPPEDELDRLARKIGTAVVQQKYSAEAVQTEAGAGLLYKLLYPSLGVAVFALLVVTSMRFHAADTLDGAVSSARFSARQVQAETHVFRELERIFPLNLRWMVQSNGDVGLGVADTACQDLEHTRALLVRVVVVRRRTGEQAWQPAWNADVIVKDGELVEVTPSKNKWNKLTLWVCPLGDGAFAVDTSLACAGPAPLAVRSNAVMRKGQPAEIAQMHAGGWECRVFQTAVPLDDAGKVAPG